VPGWCFRGWLGDDENVLGDAEIVLGDAKRLMG
jgi:hypothetical protein